MGEQVGDELNPGSEVLVVAEGHLVTIKASRKSTKNLALVAGPHTPSESCPSPAKKTPKAKSTPGTASKRQEPPKSREPRHDGHQGDQTSGDTRKAFEDAIRDTGTHLEPEVKEAVLEAVCGAAARQNAARHTEIERLRTEIMQLGELSSKLAMQNQSLETEIKKGKKKSSASDEHLREIESLKEELSSLKVFEQAAPELTKQLECLVEEKESILKERNDLLALQRNMKLTWVPDNAASRCLRCTNQFTMTRRRHHCRYCGRLFCHACLLCDASLPAMGYAGVVKVCESCATLLNMDA